MRKLLVWIGNALTLAGGLALILVIAAGLAGAEGGWIASLPGVRISVTLAIAGCLLSAIGYGIVDYRPR